uniref:Transthyretin-like family protein n=1 Tax=Parastrongyloides trichosuri TaxID=131310 RepID=A0A0N4Z8X3_PARTI
MFCKSFVFIFAILISTILGAGFIGRLQSAGARGILKCNGVPMKGVKVKLYDVDTFDIDDFMAETKTDSNGRFEIQGSHKEITTIDPKLNIYHKCGSLVGVCSRKVSIKIPDRFVSNGNRVERWYDAGTLELAGKFPGESKDCINK